MEMKRLARLLARRPSPATVERLSEPEIAVLSRRGLLPGFLMGGAAVASLRAQPALAVPAPTPPAVSPGFLSSLFGGASASDRLALQGSLLPLTQGVLAAPPTLIFVGDSQIADGWQGSGNGTTYLGRIPFWVRTYTRQRYVCDLNSHLFATSGYTTSQWITTHLANCLAAVKAAVAKGSQPVVVMKLGTNDAPAGTAAAYTTAVANFETIFTTLCGAGAIVCPTLILPRAAGAVLSANGEKVRNGLNAYFRNQRWRSDRRVLPIDTIRVMSNGDGTPLTGYLVDGLHTTPIGADVEGKAIAAFLNALYPADTLPGFVASGDIYDANLNPLGNRIAALGQMTGTTGTKGNGQATGNVPTGWTAGAYTNSNFNTAATTISGVFSSVTSSLDVPNTPMTQIALGGTAGSDMLGLTPTSIPNGAYVAGDVVQMGCTVEWDAGLTNVSSIWCMVDHWFQGAAKEGFSLDGLSPLPSGAHRLQLVTNPITLPVGYSNQNLLVRLGVQGSTAGAPSGNVRFGQLWHAKVG